MQGRLRAIRFDIAVRAMEALISSTSDENEFNINAIVNTSFRIADQMLGHYYDSTPQLDAEDKEDEMEAEEDEEDEEDDDIDDSSYFEPDFGDYEVEE